MTAMFKKLWHDPVWSKVIAAAILGSFAMAATYFLDWWPTIGEFLGSSVLFAFALSSIPNWLLLILTLLALPTLILVCIFVWQRAFPSRTHSSWQSYTADIFFGLRWRWTYGVKGQVYETYAFCPHCDYQVYAKDVSSYQVIDHIMFQCDSCGRHLGEFHEPFNSLTDKVKRFVQQKLRNGTWAT